MRSILLVLACAAAILVLSFPRSMFRSRRNANRI